MRVLHRRLVALAVLCLIAACPTEAGVELRVWRTTENLADRLAPQPSLTLTDAAKLPADAGDVVVLEVDPARTYQTLLGLGSSLEATTCSNLFRLAPASRERALERLVSPSAGIGMNLMRVCIGTSDFTGDPWYSYCDLPPGETDPDLRQFSIERDRAYILPVLQAARRLNPDLLFFASPWSPPGWMKDSGSLTGGRLLPRWYATYAQYFVRFIQAYAAEGIPLYAVTVQNEPGVDRALEKDPKWHYPSCRWTGAEERDFIRDHLGPALRRAGLSTRLWCYDHNYNLETSGDDAGLPHPRTILSDPAAAAWVAGVAFHGYVGEPEGMSRFHREFPRHPVHFTEGSVFGIGGVRELIERLRHDASSYNAWVTMLDDRGRPNNGPFPATHAILKLHSDTLQVEELLEFYAYGHFMRFLPRGAVRVGSTPAVGPVDNVVFRTPAGEFVAIAVNTGEAERRLVVREGTRAATTTIPAKAVLTLVWSAASP